MFFLENEARDYGGGMYNTYSSLTVSNSIFSKNVVSGGVGKGGGIGNYEIVFPKIINCTFWKNTASNRAGGLFNYSPFSEEGITTVANCILWDNEAPLLSEIDSDALASITVTHSDIEGGFPGTDNIDLAPDFVDPTSDDFHLQANSPCIDTGDNSIISTLDIDFDFDGESRILDGDNTGDAIVDMGADEKS